MTGFPLISLLTLVPFIGAVLVIGIDPERRNLARWLALGFSFALEEGGNALPVGGLVVQHIRGCDALTLGELRAGCALNVIAANDAVDFFITAVSYLRVRIGRGYVG